MQEANIGLKGELHASRIRCEELVEKENQVQIELAQSREKNSGLEVDNCIDQVLLTKAKLFQEATFHHHF